MPSLKKILPSREDVGCFELRYGGHGFSMFITSPDYFSRRLSKGYRALVDIEDRRVLLATRSGYGDIISARRRYFAA